MGIGADLALIIIAALLGGAVARALGLPLVLGYIAGGILVGPNTIGPTVGNVHDIELLADLGVALLLFSLGLEFPLRKLALVRDVAVWGTVLQMALTATGGYGLGLALGWGWLQSVWFGALISLSSTAVVLKVLMDREVMNTLSSRVMVGMLIVQDLAFVPLVTVLPALGTGAAGAPGLNPDSLATLGWSALRGAGFVAAMLVFGTRSLPRLLRGVVAWRSRELFIITVTAIGLGVGYGAYLLGLSLAFGAFVAGMVLSESAYAHQALADIVPLREVFTVVFFVSVGMLIEPGFLIDHAALVAGVTAVVLVGKGLVFAAVTRLFGYTNIVPVAAALSLFQVGEFSFVLARVGLATGALSTEVYATALAVAAAGMALTPVAASRTGSVYQWWRRRHPARSAGLQPGPDVAHGLSGHVVLAGFGRVGAFIARLLASIGHPFVVIDLDPSRAAAAEREQYRLLFGDAAAEPVLEAAGVRRARLVILTVPNPVSTRLAVEAIRRLSPSVHVVARAGTEEVMRDLEGLGIHEVVQPELEAGLELARQALSHLGVGTSGMQALTDLVHRANYDPLTDPERTSRELTRLTDRLAKMVEVERLLLPPGSPAADRTLGELDVRRRTGSQVIAVIRGGQLTANPGPDFRLRAGDEVAVVGDVTQRQRLRQLVEPPPIPDGAPGTP